MVNASVLAGLAESGATDRLRIWGGTVERSRDGDGEMWKMRGSDRS